MSTIVIKPRQTLEASHFTSEQLLPRLARARYADIPNSVRQRLKHCVIDWIAVTAAGASQEVARVARRTVEAEGGFGRASLLGTRGRAPVSAAAFSNAISAHALDFDSSNLWSLGHTATSVVSAVLAISEERNSSGQDLQRAILAGTEAAAVIGLATANLRESRGLHLTGFTGSFGSAVACGHLVEFDESALAQVISLAATQASGLRAVFGTMGKALNAGIAARNGVIAAKLVEAGFTAPIEAISGPSGYAKAYAIDFDEYRPGAVMGDSFGIEATAIKFHSNCHAIHAAMDALAHILREYAIRPEDVRGLSVEVPAGVTALCPFNEPAIPPEAHFSIPHAMALILAGMPTDPRGFTLSCIRDSEISRLRGIVDVRTAAIKVSVGTPSCVEVTLCDGRILRELSGYLRPPRADELADEYVRLTQKYFNLVEPVLGRRVTQSLWETVNDLESPGVARKIAELMARD